MRRAAVRIQAQFRMWRVFRAAVLVSRKSIDAARRIQTAWWRYFYFRRVIAIRIWRRAATEEAARLIQTVVGVTQWGEIASPYEGGGLAVGLAWL